MTTGDLHPDVPHPMPLAGPVAAPQDAQPETGPVTAGPAPLGTDLPTHYRASGGRRLFFSFVFLLLVPFAVSLGPMLYQRITLGHWTGLGGFLILAIGLLILTTLVGAEAIRSIRSEVILENDRVHLTLPAGHGPTPLFRYASHDIPYDRIASVETRCEVYGGYLAPMLLRGHRLMLKDGSVVRLGYVSETDVDPVFPYPQIAAQIAGRAGIPINDTGSVWRSMPRKMLGLRSSSAGRDHIDQATVARLNDSHRRFMTVVIAGLVALVIAGVATDFLAGNEGRPLPGIGSKR
jgi:hypothetical protein